MKKYKINYAKTKHIELTEKEAIEIYKYLEIKLKHGTFQEQNQVNIRKK